MSNKDKIQGGYTIEPNHIFDVILAGQPPHVRETFGLISRRVFFKDGTRWGRLVKRGQWYTSYDEIIQALSWSVGFRRVSYDRHQIETAMKTIRRTGLITTTRTTSGMIITLVNYESYQCLKSYENHNENPNGTVTRTTTRTTTKLEVFNTSEKASSLEPESDQVPNPTDEPEEKSSSKEKEPKIMIEADNLILDDQLQTIAKEAATMKEISTKALTVCFREFIEKYRGQSHDRGTWISLWRAWCEKRVFWNDKAPSKKKASEKKLIIPAYARPFPSLEEMYGPEEAARIRRDREEREKAAREGGMS